MMNDRFAGQVNLHWAGLNFCCIKRHVTGKHYAVTEFSDETVPVSCQVTYEGPIE